MVGREPLPKLPVLPPRVPLPKLPVLPPRVPLKVLSGVLPPRRVPNVGCDGADGDDTVLRVLLPRFPKLVPLPRDGMPPRLAVPKEPLPVEPPPALPIIGGRRAVPNDVALLGLPRNPLP